MPEDKRTVSSSANASRSEEEFPRIPQSNMVLFCVQKTIRKFRSLADAEKADREFYRKLSGRERLNILLELTQHEPERRLERVYRVTKLPRR
jgi:5'(3')-deoxyribonucleotidase